MNIPDFKKKNLIYFVCYKTTLLKPNEGKNCLLHPISQIKEDEISLKTSMHFRIIKHVLGVLDINFY
jgi:hypothetical protein